MSDRTGGIWNNQAASRDREFLTGLARSIYSAFFPAYNISVAFARPQDESSRKQARHALYSTEAEGLLFIAVLLLIGIVIRYWKEIHWSLR